MESSKPPITSLSAGVILRDILLDAPQLRELTERIFPVVSRDEELPYIAYARASATLAPVKGAPGAMEATVEVLTAAETYDESLELAEMVNAILDGATYRRGGVQVRSVRLVSGKEGYDGAAFVQLLTYAVRMQGTDI